MFSLAQCVFGLESGQAVRNGATPQQGINIAGMDRKCGKGLTVFFLHEETAMQLVEKKL